MRSEPSEATWAALNNKGHVEPLQYKFYCGEESGKDRTVKYNIKESEEEKKNTDTIKNP